MRIAVIGAGGVGGYFGALLARAGHDVALYARGEHLRVIRDRGITVRTDDGAFTVPIGGTDDGNDLRGASLAIIAVKSYSVPEIAPVARLLARDGTVILPLLNGVNAADDLAREGVPHEQILGGLTVVSAFRSAPGEITRVSWQERIVVGELSGELSTRATSIVDVIRSAGVESVVTTNIVIELWRKFNMLCAMACACGLARSDVGGIRDTPLGRRLIERAVREIAAVGRAKGVAIPATQEEETLRRVDALPAAMKPSFLLDLERGGPTELDVLSGAVSRFGDETGVPTPVHDTAAATLVTR